MKKIKLIYNPFSGDKSFRYDLDPCIQVLQEAGYETHIFRTTNPGDIDKHIAEILPGTYDAIAISGGDGSINLTINAIMNHQLQIPLGIIPSGTANDFAHFLKIPSDPVKAVQIIAQNNIQKVDLGLVNDRYFINVCAAGMFTNISQTIDINFKNTFGKLAYYVKGVEQLPNFMPMRLRITNSTQVFEEDVYFFFVLNSAGTGGFEKLSPGASIDDGLFDFIAFKAFPIHEIAVLFVKMLTGEYLDDNRILFFRDKTITVEPIATVKNSQLLETDIDGEAGPKMPIEITNLHHAFQIFMPEKAATNQR